MKQNNVDKWCEGKSCLVASVAREICLESGVLLQLLSDLREGGAISELSDGLETAVWVKLYRQRRWIQEVLLRSFLPEHAETGLAMLEEMKVCRTMSPEELQSKLLEELPQTWASLSDSEKTRLIESAQALTPGGFTQVVDDTLADDEAVDELLTLPEVLFLVKVSIPCWLQYGQVATRLMRDARLGKLEALERLLRIDKAVIHDRKIWVHWECERRRGGERFKRLNAALAGKPTRRLSAGRVKVCLAAFLKVTAERSGCRLTYPELDRLFEAAARDKGATRDMDLQEDPAAFKKAVQRDLKLWKFLR
jgi:hypothetical protein